MRQPFPTPSPSALQELVCPGAEPRWSLAELIHAVVLMAHAHSLCSFVWGCGLNPEPEHIGGYTFQPPSPNHLPRSPHSPANEDSRQEVSLTSFFTTGLTGINFTMSTTTTKKKKKIGPIQLCFTCPTGLVTIEDSAHGLSELPKVFSLLLSSPVG